jgi:hypothetical protein
MTRLQIAFGALVLTQAAHSVEEYAGRLWETFPPAAFMTGLVSQDHEVGFLVINLALVMFGVWCVVWPAGRRWPSAAIVGWFWVTIQLINGVIHPLWSLRMGAYTPGVAMAPLLFVAALYLAGELRRMASHPPGSA